MRLLIIFVLILLTNLALAQRIRLSVDSMQVAQKEAKQKAIKWAEDNGRPVRQEYNNGVIVELQYIDKNNQPVYYRTENTRAGQGTNTNTIQKGGSLGLNLTGKNQVVGVWDGGLVLNHQEFSGRALVKDNASALSTHATHVTGTIIAAGINQDAKGMATEGVVWNYDWNSDNSEMVAAASNGLVLSNHSYGTVLGWDYNPNNNTWSWMGDAAVSTTEDYRFGLYTSAAATWDNIAYQYPNYLIVKSAGNDRSDIGGGPQPPDGPYDCIGPAAVAKNILTVGAVRKLNGKYTQASDVVMTQFSSWGPTDDGRIKPDICGVGQDLISASSSGTDKYETLSGTSMAAPNVSGSLILLQQLYNQKFGGYMKSASLKGLIIHTANEAGGAKGPDYQYGWGLLNSERAAKQILLTNFENFQMKELSLSQGSDYVEEFMVGGIGVPLTFTLVWTDLPGVAENRAILDPTDIRLINDLDIRIIKPNGAIEMPYVVNPQTYQVSTGDNFRDNVEKIEFVADQAGVYTIKISHKGTLVSGNQNFSLIYSLENIDATLQPVYFSGVDNNLSEQSNWFKDKNTTIPLNRIPNSRDIIIFPPNTTPSAYVLNADLSAYGISFEGGAPLNIEGNGHNVHITGFIDLSSTSKVHNTRLWFEGDNADHFIKASLNNFENVSLYVTGAGGHLNVLGSLKLNELNVTNAQLTSIKNSHEISVISIAGENSKVEFLNDTIKGINRIESEGNVLAFKQCQLEVDTPNIFVLNIDGSINSTVILSGDGSINATEVDQILLNGKLRLMSDVLIGSLKINSDSELEIMEDATLTILDKFQILNNSHLSLSSTGNRSYIAGRNANKFCLDDLMVSNVDVVGECRFVVPITSSISEADGWYLGLCSDVLDAKFTYSFVCEKGITIFRDESDGFPDSYRWSVTINGKEVVETGKNAEISFPEKGQYMISLTVGQGDETSTISSLVTIVAASLGVPEIIFSDNKLRSTRFAPNYQWFLDGIPLQGATGNELVPTQEGIYYIDIWNSSCRMRSTNYSYVITSTDTQVFGDSIVVYPNPAVNTVYIDMPEDIMMYDVHIFNLLGDLVYSKRFFNREGSISLEQFAKGAYFVHINFNGRHVVKRVLKQ